MPQVKCKICNKEFHVKPNLLKNGLGKYCSLKCMGKQFQQGELRKCFICKKEIYKSRKALLSSKSKNFFCSKSCQTVWRNSIVNVGADHPNWKGGKHVSYRNLLRKNKVAEICFLCENDDKRVLAVHHIDKNHTNNSLPNLIWLCHNCHALIHRETAEKKILLEKLKNR